MFLRNSQYAEAMITAYFASLPQGEMANNAGDGRMSFISRRDCATGVPRTTDGEFQDGSSAPFSSEGMVTFGQAIREGKMAVHTDDFRMITGRRPITVRAPTRGSRSRTPSRSAVRQRTRSTGEDRGAGPDDPSRSGPRPRRGPIAARAPEPEPAGKPHMSSVSSPRRPDRAARPSRTATDEGPRASLRQLLPFVFEHKKTLIAVAILSVLAAAATLAQPLVVGQVIERVQQSAPLGTLVWVLVALVVASSLISGIQHYLLQRTGTAVVYSSRRRLIAQLLHLPVQEYDARRTGDLVSRVGTDTTLLYAVLTQGLADSVGNALIFVGAVIAMLLIDPVLLLLILVVVGASVAVVGALSGRIRRATTVQQEKVGELASGVERAIGSIRTIRASGAASREQAAIDQTARGAYDAGVQVAKASAFIVPIAGIALQLSLLVVLGVGGFRVASGAITIAQLVTFVMFLFFLVQPLGSFFGAITSVNQALGALGRIQEVLDLPTETCLLYTSPSPRD